MDRWGRGREREKPPAAGLANSLSSHWRCYGERGWKSAAPDLHVISRSLSPLVSEQAPTLCACLGVENVLRQWENDFSETIMRCTRLQYTVLACCYS